MIKRKIFGLDISDHSIEALILTKPFFGKPKFVSYARTILHGEIVKDGIIKKPDKLAESIVKLLESAKPRLIKTPYCILSLPESQVFTAVFKLPAGLKRNEIKNTIPYKAEEVIPFKSSEIYFDFKTIFVKDATQEVFYVAVPTKIVDSYVEVLEKINLKPVAFDLESISLARAVIDSSQKSGKAKLIMDIGARTTNLNVYDRNGIRQNLTIKFAGDRFTKAIATKLKIKPKEADELKIKNGFDPKKQKGKVLLILQNEFKRIIVEAKKLIDYYQTQNQRQIDKIILVGGSSLLPQVDQYLADNLALEVDIGNPLEKFIGSPELTKLKDKAVLFVNVTGLALRGVNRDPIGSDINLLPFRARKIRLTPERADQKSWRLVYIRLAVLIIFISLLGGLLFIRNQGRDVLGNFFPGSDYNYIFNSDFNVDALDELRGFLEDPASIIIEEEIIEPEEKVKIADTSFGYINVREGPGINFSKIGQAESGIKYVLFGEQDGWYQIQLDEETLGWVSGTLAELVEPSAVEEGENPEVLGEAVELIPKIRVKETGLGYLNVREGAGTDFEKIGQVLPGQEFEVLEQENDWYKINFTAKTPGWVSSIYVDKLE